MPIPLDVRADFPLLQRSVDGKPLVYLDSAATSQKPRAVLEALQRYYEEYNANVHRGLYRIAERATLAYEEARAKVAAFVGAQPEELVFTRGTTEAINLVAYAWGDAFVRAGDEVLVTEMEHHSNLVPWQLLAQRRGARLRVLRVRPEDGTLDLDALDRLLTERTRIVAVAHQSNVVGTINPVRYISERAHAVGAVVVVDGAQSVPHMPVRVGELGCDFLAFSGHKMCGPTGIGALWGRRELLEAMPPFHGGGEMIERVELEHSTYKDPPHRFEAGTPNIADAIALGVEVEYLRALGMEAVREHEKALVRYAMAQLAEVRGVRLYGPKDPELRGGEVRMLTEDHSVINELKRQYKPLSDLVTTIPVVTNSGSRVLEKYQDITGFTQIVAEDTTLAALDNPKVKQISYSIKDYGGIITLTNNLLADSPENIMSFISKWIARKEVITDNSLILAILTAQTPKAIGGLDDLKEVINVSLDPMIADGAVIVTNQDGYNYLDTQKDGMGRYLLQPDPTQPGRKLFDNKPVIVFANRLIPTTGGKAPIIIGDLKESVVIFDRQQMSMLSTNIGGGAFENNTTKTRVIDREDVKAWDDGAWVYGQITIS
ncbi:MAG: phage major capsid protein [Firmicutes bacterium]|nr:phage major capsid protein [Bacillota bacterium]